MVLPIRSLVLARNTIWILFITISLVTLFVHTRNYERPMVPEKVTELFDPHLQGVRSIDAAVTLVKQDARSGSPYDIALAADLFVRNRFFHQYSEFRPDQNWIAWLLGKIWPQLSAPVLPDDILQYRRAACSQQSIVFMEIMKRLGFEVRAVGLTGHYVAAVKMPNGWQVFDANMNIPVASYPLADLLSANESVLSLYPALRESIKVDAARARIDLRPINADPAPNAGLLHRVTAIASNYLWIVMLSLALAFSRATERRRKTDACGQCDNRRSQLAGWSPAMLPLLLKSVR